MSCKHVELKFRDLLQALREDKDLGTREFRNYWIGRSDDALRYYRHFLAKRGIRYYDSTLDNYSCNTAEQKGVLDKLRQYADEADDNFQKGKNVVLFGPRGSGKDHLAVGLVRELFAITGVRVLWYQGVDLLREFDLRDRGRSESRPHEKEIPLLYISDLLPPSGTLSERQQCNVFRMLDHRYSCMLPTIVTLNVADAKDAESRLGAQILDRLRDGALTLNTNWETYRSSGRSIEVSIEKRKEFDELSKKHKNPPDTRIYQFYRDFDHLYGRRIIPESHAVSELTEVPK
ncbi:ATP-binding protein [Pirellulaceae bacterium SH449]